MAEVLTLDVIDRPSREARQALRRLRSGDGGTRALIRTMTGDFAESLRKGKPPTNRRVAVLAGWDPQVDLEERWGSLLGPLVAGSREHWHVRGEITRASFSEPWRGWVPDVEGARPHELDEPALVVIAGDLRLGGALPFLRDAPKTVAWANRHPGYLGGLAIASSRRNTTSCSAWRTYADARDYAFNAGTHREAMLRDRQGAHHRTDWFFRIRPEESRGTLRGRDPFAAALAAA